MLMKSKLVEKIQETWNMFKSGFSEGSGFSEEPIFGVSSEYTIHVPEYVLKNQPPAFRAGYFLAVTLSNPFLI